MLGFAALPQGLSAGMTMPTFDSFITIVLGWIFDSRRTVTRMILAAGDAAPKHYSSYHRLFSAARWSLDRLRLTLLALVEPRLEGETLLALDDTLARKRGGKMFGAAMHYDPPAVARPPPHQLGPQLGRLGSAGRTAVSTRPSLLPAAVGSAVRQSDLGP